MTSPARLATALRAHAQGLYCPEGDMHRPR